MTRSAANSAALVLVVLVESTDRTAFVGWVERARETQRSKERIATAIVFSTHQILPLAKGEQEGVESFSTAPHPKSHLNPQSIQS